MSIIRYKTARKSGISSGFDAYNEHKTTVCQQLMAYYEHVQSLH